VDAIMLGYFKDKLTSAPHGIANAKVAEARFGLVTSRNSDHIVGLRVGAANDVGPSVK
jgi:hypothetical protein